MAAGGKRQQIGNLLNRHVGMTEHLIRGPDFFMRNILLSRQAGFRLEQAFGQPREPGQITQADWFIQMLRDIGLAACLQSSGIFHGMVSPADVLPAESRLLASQKEVWQGV